MSRLHFHCRHAYPDGFHLDAAFEADDSVTALFGPSGSGKSTILALIAGILRPQEGRIVLSGETLFDSSAGRCLPPERRRVGFVFQDHLLFPHLTVRQNLNFGQQRRPSRSIDLNRVAEVLEIGDLLERRPATLSGGQRQRVSLGRALLRGPELLLMDEPLAALDVGLKDRILTYLERALAEWHIPTLLVSHDQADVRRLADQVVVLEAGRVIDAGPVAVALDRAVLTHRDPAFVPSNLLRVREVRQTAGHWQGRVGEQVLHLPAAHTGPEVRVRFLARDVALARAVVEGVSVRNQLRGRIRELVPFAERVLVAVDVGQFLWAEVTTEAVREMALQPGDAVVCLLKTTAMQLLD
ncbi:MAG: molybdenum ABC transporter ATP-binding protein [Planctomycetia bacterium]|nr:molybdenum ABC transporter ATP-binding protein [Planctomycetia bacterium]